MQLPSICVDRISEIREARQSDERSLAARARAQALANADAIPSSIAAMLDSLGDEDGWECCICKEGYSLHPTDPLGFYVFVSPTSNLCSTGFTCVHYRCHSGTWEMARLRNSEKECNAIFPIPSDSLDPALYRDHVVKFYRGCTNPFMTCLSEMALHLQRLGTFSAADFRAGGGSIANELGWLPFLINAGHILLDRPRAQVDGVNRGAMETEMQKTLDGKADVGLGFALSLWVMSLAEWIGFKLGLLGVVVKNLRIAKEVDDNELFRRTRSILIQFVVTHKLQELLKKPTQAAKTSDFGIAPHTGDPWITDFQRELGEEGMTKCNEWKELGEFFERSVLSLGTVDQALTLTDDLGRLSAFGHRSAVGWLRTFCCN
jgi:hypothetical protein